MHKIKMVGNVLNKLVVILIVLGGVVLGAAIAGGALSADSGSEDIESLIRDAAPPLKGGRALAWDRNDPLLPTLLIDTNDGSIVREYAGTLRLLSERAGRMFLGPLLNVSGAQEIFLAETIQGDILASYSVPQGLDGVVVSLGGSGQFRQRATVSWFKRSARGMDCDFALAVPCQTLLIDTASGEIIEVFESISCGSFDCLSVGSFDCSGRRLLLHKGGPNGVFDKTLVDTASGATIIPVGDPSLDGVNYNPLCRQK